MNHAIGIRLRQADRSYPKTASRMLGSAKIPLEWMLDELYENELFLCQLNLSKLAPLDPLGRLPHKGYLYVFLQMERLPRPPKARVLYFDGEPDYFLFDANENVEGYEHLTLTYAIEFCKVDANARGTKLLGVPNPQGALPDESRLLLQFDPREGDTGFLHHFDGTLCILFGPEGRELEGATARLIPNE